MTDIAIPVPASALPVISPWCTFPIAEPQSPEPMPQYRPDNRLWRAPAHHKQTSHSDSLLEPKPAAPGPQIPPSPQTKMPARGTTPHRFVR
ncbi:TPA: hypothetical protein ACX6QU_003401 [Photobacterium damselae]